MNFVGIDLRKKTISISAVNQEREILDRKRLFCSARSGSWCFSSRSSRFRRSWRRPPGVSATALAGASCFYTYSSNIAWKMAKSARSTCSSLL